MHTIAPPSYSHLGQIFEYWALQNPEQTALLAPERPSLTHAALGNKLATMGEKLQSLGLGESAHIAVLAPNGPELAMAFLTCAGYATCAPLNPAYQKDEIAFYLDDLEHDHDNS